MAEIQQQQREVMTASDRSGYDVDDVEDDADHIESEDKNEGDIEDHGDGESESDELQASKENHQDRELYI